MEDRNTRREPPEDEDDWAYLWDGAFKARTAWIIVGPIHALVSNWKLLVLAAAAVVYLNKPEIVNALTVLIGGEP